jgi:hypothetical protein
MKYDLDTEVIYRKTGKLVRIHDYSHRYKEYTLIGGGHTHRGVSEDEITTVKEESK